MVLGGLGLAAAGLGIVVSIVIAVTQLPSPNPILVALGLTVGIALIVVGLAAAVLGFYRTGEPKRRSARLAELIGRGQDLAKEAEPLGEYVPPSPDLLGRMESWDADNRSFLDKWPHQLVVYNTGLFTTTERPLGGRNDTLGWIASRLIKLDNLTKNAGLPGDGVGAWG